MAEVQERRKKTVEASMTEQVHLIMQQHLNGGGRLFGGALMQWLDEVAGVVAMHPKCIVLDEPTAMLDPNGRKEVIRTVRALNEVEEVTVILSCGNCRGGQSSVQACDL